VLYLIIVLAAPALGPVLYAMFHGGDRAVQLVDRFVYVSVPALVAWQVAPFAIQRGIPLVLGAVVGGFLVPTIFERASRSLEAHADNLAIVVGLSGLVIHATLEGAAFAPVGTPTDAAFGLAVALHRVPVGLIIWSGHATASRQPLPGSALSSSPRSSVSLLEASSSTQFTAQARSSIRLS